MKIKKLIQELNEYLKGGYTDIQFYGIDGELLRLSNYQDDKKSNLIVWDLGTMEDNETWNSTLN